MRAEIAKTHPVHEAAPSIASFVIRLQAPPSLRKLLERSVRLLDGVLAAALVSAQPALPVPTLASGPQSSG